MILACLYIGCKSDFHCKAATLHQLNTPNSNRCDRIRNECTPHTCSFDISNGYLNGYFNNAGAVNTLHCLHGYANSINHETSIEVKW